MQIQTHTDTHLTAGDGFARKVAADVEAALDRFQHQVTRVEVHIVDVNGAKGGGDDVRCLIEARIAGRDPVAVHHQADGLDVAFAGALGKIERALDHAVARRQEHRGPPHHGAG